MAKPAKPVVLGYSVTITGTHRGHEGEPCASGKLKRDGKVVALVDDDDHGGPLRFEWLDRKGPKENVTTDWYGHEATYAVSHEEALLIAHCKTLPALPSEYGGAPLRQDPELFVGLLMEEEQYRKDFKRAVSKKTLFLEDGKIYEIRALGPDVVARLKQRHPAAVVLNDLPEVEALALWIRIAKGC
jgi:hypothetical protein